MGAVIEQFLDDKIGSLQFDDRVFHIDDHTGDSTVNEVAYTLLSNFFDDPMLDKVVASPQMWNCIQRLLLILKSNARIVVSSRKRWTLRQLVAIACIVLFCILGVRSGFGYHLFLFFVPCSIAAALLIYWRRRDDDPAAPRDVNTYMVPFSSFGQVLKARRSVSRFRKARYPERLRGRRIRSRLAETVLWPVFVMQLVLFSPLLLLIQVLPETCWEWTVEMS